MNFIGEPDGSWCALKFKSFKFKNSVVQHSKASRNSRVDQTKDILTTLDQVRGQLERQVLRFF